MSLLNVWYWTWFHRQLCLCNVTITYLQWNINHLIANGDQCISIDIVSKPQLTSLRNSQIICLWSWAKLSKAAPKVSILVNDKLNSIAKFLYSNKMSMPTKISSQLTVLINSMCPQMCQATTRPNSSLADFCYRSALPRSMLFIIFLSDYMVFSSYLE